MRFATAAVLAMVITVGCNRHDSILGQSPIGPSRTVASLSRAKAEELVVLRGAMIEKCPVAGCWFRLRDETGTIKVDTRAAGFVVAKVPVRQNLVVSGKVVADGDGFSIQATGVRY